MLRRSNLALNSVNFRNKKKYPYLVHHHKLPWNTVEPGTELSHKILAPCFLRLIQSASMMRINGLVMNNNNNNSLLPDIPEDQWLFSLPASTFIVPVSQKKSSSQSLIVDNEEEEQETSSSSSSSLAPYGWFGKRVVDDLSLTHYGPLASTIAPVLEVAEFRSPDLRIICNAVRLGQFYDSFNVSSNSSLSSSNNNNNLCIYHFYRPNRSPFEMEGAFQQYLHSTVERPDLSALEEIIAQGGSFKPTMARSSKSGGNATASPMPQGPIPTSPQHGLIERDAIRPGDTFGCRSKVWGHFW